MKRHLFLFVTLLLTVSTMWAQDFNQTDSKGRRQGSWRDFYPNGQLRYEGQFKNDKCKGEFRYYDQEGHLKATNTFDKSSEKALNKTYSPNGKMIATGYYLNQKKEGEWRYFDKETGRLRLVEDNKAGKVEGWSRIYNPDNGNLAEETQYVNGLPDGVCRKFSDMGVLLMECHYQGGQLEGSVKTYYPSSALKEEGQYTHGEKTGLWKTYNEDGDVVLEDSYGD